MSFRQPISLASGGIRVAVALLLLITFASPADARKKEPEFATSANDLVLRGAIAALWPNVVDPEEAQQVAQIAYTTGRDFKREWGVTWPPGFHNFLVNTGAKKGGLCFQFAEKLLLRLAEQKWETVEFHWAESFERSLSEHNVIVVTAKDLTKEDARILSGQTDGIVTKDQTYLTELAAAVRGRLERQPVGQTESVAN